LALPLFALRIVPGIMPAQAEGLLRRSDPASAARLDRSPSEVFMWFASPIQGSFQAAIFDGEFRDMSRGEAFVDPDDVTLIRLPVRHLPAGRYTVKWRVTTRDGRSAEGLFDFTVRSPPIPLPVVVATAAGSVILVVSMAGWVGLRWLRRSR
jgi:methionine-rich copper-binding protein CopC